MIYFSVTRSLAAALAAALLLCASGIHPQGSRVYGDITAIMLNQRFNPDSLVSDALINADTMVAALSSDFYVSMADPQLGSVFLDLSMDSSLTRPDVAGEKRSILAIRQFFLQAPLVPSVFITGGIKAVSMGYASFFNVSNRLSPRSAPGMEQAGENPGLVQLDWYPAEFLNMSGILYFSGKSDWSKIGLMAAMRLQLDPLNVDAYGYLENLENPFLGYNASVQLGILGLYAEGLLGRREQLSLTAAPEESLAVSDKNGLALAQAAGLTLDADTASITLEYQYRSEGLPRGERDKLRDYLVTLPDAGSLASAISSCYRRNSWDSHYLAFSVSGSLLERHISTGAVLVASAGENPADWRDSAGILGRLTLTFNPSTSLHLSVFVEHSFGGKDSEYILFNTGSLVGGLVLSFAFSTKTF